MSRGVRSAGPSGPALLDELRDAAAAAGVTLAQFVAPLATSTPYNYISCLGKATRPMALTVARARALIAGEAIPAARPSPFEGHFGGPARFVTGEHIESKLGREAKQAMGDRARAERRPGETLADAVRRIGREIEAEEQTALEAEASAGDVRREQELAELASPSSLIRRAERDWPTHSASVAAIASAMGIAKGEAWSRVIAAGIDTLSEGAG